MNLPTTLLILLVVWNYKLFDILLLCMGGILHEELELSLQLFYQSALQKRGGGSQETVETNSEHCKSRKPILATQALYFIYGDTLFMSFHFNNSCALKKIHEFIFKTH